MADNQNQQAQLQLKVQQLKAERVQHVQQAPTIGEANAPHRYYQNISAICIPEIQTEYDLTDMAILVKQNAYHGLASENPMEHIEDFEELCGISSLPADFVKCKLFPHSLADKGKMWLRCLPPASLTTWDEIRAAFLNRFYIKSRTATLKNKIITFCQLFGESEWLEAVHQLHLKVLQLEAGGVQHVQQARTIGEANAIHRYYRNRSAICIPEIQTEYDLTDMTILVKQNAYHGLASENPMKHIEDFEQLCGISLLPAGFVMCKLFPFSLADKGKKWLRSLPPASLTTWDEIRSAFLDHFYIKSKTATLRNRIITFSQLSGESFCEAWKRFEKYIREYIRECPHHGYTNEQLLESFFDGVDQRNHQNIML